MSSQHNFYCLFTQSFMRIACSAEVLIAQRVGIKAGCLALAAMLWMEMTSVKAATYYVATNGNHQTPFTNWADAATNIQDAVNVAIITGDIVLVSNGVYTTTTPTTNTDSYGLNTEIVSLTNQMILKSVNGPSVTVIDGNYPTITARCVYMKNRATLDGFTVRNGRAWAPSCGNPRGGGIGSMSGVGATVTNCIIHNNTAQSKGGGINMYDMIGVVANCTIYSNTAANGGGMQAEYAYDGTMVNNCIFWGNECNGTTNWYNSGGGLFSAASTLSVKNCLFYRNISATQGGGIKLEGTTYTPVLENCTITSNSAPYGTGGGCYIEPLLTQARNLIIYNNYARDNYPDAFTTNLNILTNSCIGDTNGVPNWNTSGNITNNPQFVNAATNNYRLSSGSPCINAGLNQSWMMTNAVDLDGGKRIFNGIVDIGAYEYVFQGTIYKAW